MPLAIAGQPMVWAGVGAPNASSNQARVFGLKTASGSTRPGYLRRGVQALVLARVAYSVSGLVLRELQLRCDLSVPHGRRRQGRTRRRTASASARLPGSWRTGRVGDIDVSGLAAVLVVRYDDDEPGSPWTIVLHVDAAGDDAQRAALADVFLGRLGGPQGRRAAVGAEDAASGGGAHRTRSSSWRTVRVTCCASAKRCARVPTRPAAPDSAVRCVIPGYDEPGRELVADELVVHDDPFSWELTENCAFASRFAYASE